MNNREIKSIKTAFTDGKAFIPFITCGDPSLDVTKTLITTMAEAGADLIELGIPFSDPTAEGVVIQGANERALSTGVTTDKIFDMLTEVEVDIPLVFMTYANVLFSYGIERFVQKAKAVGISGIILPDVPYEEKEEFETICDQYDLAFISLIAPNSEGRVKMIAKEAKGFVYCVSSLGVTGVRSGNSFASGIESTIALIKENTDTPCAIGFGISTPEQAKEMSQYADGIIVGSAIVKLCEKYKEECVSHIAEYVKSMKEAMQ